MKAIAGPALKFAEPSICLRYHWPGVSSSRVSAVNFSAPSGKCPQKITTYAHTLRITFAVTLAVSVCTKFGPVNAGKST
ncbi:Uncharacterised protein [Mycobacteroides abscessus subsp. abscessus]|nr:Uncharacterised protein [Mycobacteroides abscessus subsp. abscessus]